ncbi:NAD(P)H-dependent oxidoreductase [Flexibacterium corallicola]|uniref:NAD(P)H-dependent oxidoreductase n=1 Tax=Flexibacterium corallicola TaxID=3037259 RepID=UPI00286F311D|nr:NAD(P)H-dependent oxidoreductase [Pseudovibrio sp. M1P-2-3]
MSQHPIVSDLAIRKTAKRYDPNKRVPKELMEVLYEALRLTASSINSQPWKFIVLESGEAKARMGETFVNMFQFNKRQVLDASHVILLAHNPRYTREDYAKVVDTDIASNRTAPEERDSALAKFAFAEMNTDENGNTSAWTNAQTYIALGNALHVLARLNIDGTPMDGVDTALISKVFEKELNGYVCSIALALGYHHNATLPKSRLPKENVLQVL